MRGRIGQNWKYNPNKDDVVKTETISGHMRPATNKDVWLSYPGNSFKANPLKLWRKQSIPVQEIVRTKDVNQFYDTPGATTIRTIKQFPPPCDDCANETLIPPVNITYRNKNKEDYFDLSDTTNYVNQCPIDTVARTKCVTVCDPAHKARMAVRYPSAINTDSSKPKYYTSNASYLQARCRTYSQNNFQYGNVNETKCGILNDPKAFRPNCQGCRDTWQKYDVLLKYTENKEDYNLNHKTMDEILLSDWFNIDLPKSWESYETLPSPCWTFCDGFQKKDEAE